MSTTTNHKSSYRYFYATIHHDDFDRVSDDGNPKVSRSEPDSSPDEPVPQGNPMEMAKRILHEWIEGKRERAGDQRKRRETSARICSTPGRFEFGKPPQEKAAKIYLYEQGDAADEPRHHEQDRKPTMGCLFQEGDIVAERRIDRENYEGIQTSQQ